MAVTTEQIKELRKATGVSVMQCKQALEEADGDMEKAVILLRKLSSKAASKKADRELGSGIVASYIHGGGSVGSMVELLCETDFVSKNEEFKTLAKEIAMQVAATAPEFVRAEDVNESDTEKAKAIFVKEAADKPEEMREKIVAGKLESFLSEKTLMNQAYIKDPSMTVGKLVEEGIQKFGEKIEIGEISRFAI